jgi:Zn-dependent peptidase ImmA (M78 family)/transcriptional regulator with XRE-family HTH domain
MIYGERVKQARELCGLTQTELAEDIEGLGQPQLSRIEKGFLEPSPDLLVLIAGRTGLQPQFFEQQPAPSLDTLSLRYRSRARLSERERQRSCRWADLVLEQTKVMAEQLETGPVRLTRHTDLTPERAAQFTRRLLGLGPHEPVPYLILAMERLGVVVLGLPHHGDRHDAFCGWRDGQPVMALLNGAPGDRLRFSAAHELGHLVLHDEATPGPQAEDEADRFAAELLVPYDAMAFAIPQDVTLSALRLLKAQWRVSLRTLVRQGRAVGVIDDERYTSLFRQLSARGWTKQEPVQVAVEKPRGFRKMAELLYGPHPEAGLVGDSRWTRELAVAVLDRHARREELPAERTTPGVIHPANVVALRPRRRA